MQSPRLLCAPALVVVAGILPQKRRQERTANHDVCKVVGVVCAQPLGVALHASNIFEASCHLSDSCKQPYSDFSKWVSGEFESEAVLQLRSKRCWMRIKHFEEIGDDAKTALLLLHLDLLGGNFQSALGLDSNLGTYFFNLELDARQNFVLARLEEDI